MEGKINGKQRRGKRRTAWMANTTEGTGLTNGKTVTTAPTLFIKALKRTCLAIHINNYTLFNNNNVGL